MYAELKKIIIIIIIRIERDKVAFVRI